MTAQWTTCSIGVASAGAAGAGGVGLGNAGDVYNGTLQGQPQETCRGGVVQGAKEWRRWASGHGDDSSTLMVLLATNKRDTAMIKWMQPQLQPWDAQSSVAPNFKLDRCDCTEETLMR